ncbi:hypothetical protein C8J56DRAFT_1159677 [Mycena floridula]|nr:hypothetical protein C8J56DRAFT_1159677 [Mycena floridula]
MSVTAEDLKASGVECYKSQRLSEAIFFFKQASELEPENPVYLSNLSLAQYENGEYTAAADTCSRALSLLPESDKGCPKLLARKSKAILYSESATNVEVFDDTLSQQRDPNVKKQISQVNDRLVSIPHYRPSIQTALEYYVIGHDNANSIFRDPTSTDPDLYMKIPEDGSPFHFSAFFCGIGDARHLYASLIDAGQQCPTSMPQDMSIHFTVNDIHATALARDLIVMFTLEELSTFQNFSSGRPRQLLVMLHYVYWAAVMPPYTAKTLDKMIEVVCDEVEAAVNQSTPMDLGWVYVELKSCKAILESLRWWRTSGKKALEFDEILPPFEKVRAYPPTAELERLLYPFLRVLVPPSDCEEPEDWEDTVFRPIREGRILPEKLIPVVERMQLRQPLSNRWTINYTMLDRASFARSPRLQVHPFEGGFRLFSPSFKHLEIGGNGGSLYDVSARFFSLVAQGFARLKSTLKIEIMVGEGYSIMEQIRLETLRDRPVSFPVLFDRVHGSNVQDYVGGHLTNFTLAMPILKAHNQAYFTCRNLLNIQAWEGNFHEYDGQKLRLSSQLYTYTGAVFNQIEGAFGVRLQGALNVQVNRYHTYMRSTSGPHLLPREVFTGVAAACFFRTVLPVKYEYNSLHPNLSGQVREVVNVHSFFRALELWKNIGYPVHALSGLVQSILDNTLKSISTPHQAAPAELPTSVGKLVGTSTLPFLAEFEVAAALWQPRLFPIPSSALPDIRDIGRYSIKIPLLEIPALEGTKNHKVLLLVFGLPSDMDEISLDPRDNITNSTYKTSIHLISTFEHDFDSQTCTVLLSKRRARTFIDRGYEAGLVNVTGWMLQSRFIPCTIMQEVGDIDRWNKKIAIPYVRGRDLTEEHERAWEEQHISIKMGGMEALRQMFFGLG